MANISSVNARARFKDAYRASRLCMSMFDRVAEVIEPFCDAAPTAINYNLLLGAVGQSVRSTDPAIDRAVRIARDPLGSDPLLKRRRWRNISLALKRDARRGQDI